VVSKGQRVGVQLRRPELRLPRLPRLPLLEVLQLAARLQAVVAQLAARPQAAVVHLAARLALVAAAAEAS
jgi:hypothetical protein